MKFSADVYSKFKLKMFVISVFIEFNSVVYVDAAIVSKPGQLLLKMQ